MSFIEKGLNEEREGESVLQRKKVMAVQEILRFKVRKTKNGRYTRFHIKARAGDSMVVRPIYQTLTISFIIIVISFLSAIYDLTKINEREREIVNW